MKLYITDMSLFVLAVFYLPLVLWLLWKILKQPMHWAKKVVFATLMLMLAYVIPLGDVTVNSIAMAKVCPNAGLHIYKTVEVEGYITYLGDGKMLMKYPYRFLETRQMNANGTYSWNHFERQAGDEISYKQLNRPMAEYEVALIDWHVDIAQGTETRTEVIRNRITGEVFAERNMFNPLPGWVDKLLVFRWFGTGGRRGCWGDPLGMIDATKILIPKRSNR